MDEQRCPYSCNGPHAHFLGGGLWFADSSWFCIAGADFNGNTALQPVCKTRVGALIEMLASAVNARMLSMN